jgi:cytochrome P450
MIDIHIPMKIAYLKWLMTTTAPGFQYERPPGPRFKFPYLFSLQFLKAPLTVLNDLTTKYGDISYFKFGRQGIYFVNHPDYIQSVLMINQSKFIKNPGLRLTKRIIGNGLLTSEGEYHKQQRGLIQPAFDYSHIAMYADIITSCGEELCEKWRQTVVPKETEMTVDVHHEMTKLTVSIISNVLFGSNISSNTTAGIIHDVTILVGYFNHLRLPFIGNIIEKLPLASSRKFHASRRRLDSLIFAIIQEAKQNLMREDKMSHVFDSLPFNDFEAKDKNSPRNLLSTLLLLDIRRRMIGSDKTSTVMTMRQLRDEIMTLFLAGHETTANALTWTLYLISQNHQVEAKIIEEIKQVLENKRRPTVEDIPKFQYLRNVFTESLRLYPPAWAIGREATDTVVMGGYTIPPGSVVIMSQYITHRDPRYFAEPNKFIPERWSPEMKSNLHKFAFFPFGGGSRVCMGEPLAWIEGILLLVTLLRNWKIELVPEHPVVLSPLITLRPKYGMKMIIKRR